MDKSQKRSDFKLPPKNFEGDYTRPQEFKLRTKERAVKRAMFNFEVAAKLYIIDIKKKQIQRLQKVIEEEEIRRLRKEMIPRAQLMPYFDRPFYPQRSRLNSLTFNALLSLYSLFLTRIKIALF